MRALAVLVLLAACGGGAAAPALEEPPIPQAPAGTDREAIKREAALVEDVATRACACKDEACWGGIDQELGRYFRETMTLNDPVTDLETWPADLDARARRAFLRIADCMTAAEHPPHVFGAILARVVSDFKDAACGCPDADCARRVKENLEQKVAEMSNMMTDPATLQEISTTGPAVMACLEKHLGSSAQQAILDLKVLRRDACACTDAACADALEARFDQFLEDHKDTQGDEAEAEQIGALATEMSSCLRAARGEAP